MIELKNWEDVKGKIEKELMENSFVYVSCTDRVFLCDINDSVLETIDFDLLLEMRVFNQKEEYRIIRPNIGTGFRERTKTDDSLVENIDYFDQDQYMDIKEVQDGNTAISINGGSYKLPRSGVNNKAGMMIKIRNYIKYNESDGQARVDDWRIVGFVEG